MKTNEWMERNEKTCGTSMFRDACAKSCKRILAQLRNAKRSILAEARNTVKVQDQWLRLALNEAEALSWQTLYPHLVFPMLATEKIQRIATWNNHQRAVAALGRRLS